YCMVAYNLNLTLSENGTVSRGVCGVDEEQNLTSMVERTKIERMPNGQIVFHDLGEDEPLEEDTPVSMNLFGFTPDYFAHTEAYFQQWFSENSDHLKGEFYIPTMVNKLIADGTSKLRVLRSAAQWHGVTYKEDKPALVAAIQKMIAEGKYPAKLWE
ncbi:MAG: nucleotidyltransferase, partial [Alistipes sp.]|nr:nucleotidyltransferase [Alistipes sp.]